ncbi:MAG: Rieske (2Fe-2S) protein [Clostridia bacterium]|nr:Rieske (2Fe-2S) protein [Clostridia bacterium]
MPQNKKTIKRPVQSQASDSDKSQVGRRAFIKKAWWGLGAVAGLEVIWAFASFLSPRRKLENANVSSIKTVGNIANLAKGSVTPFRSGQFYLVRLEDGGLLALSLKCTHLACSVSWDAAGKQFVCPCHASQFDMTGNVINPPAPRALDYYPVIVEQGIVKVDIGKAMKRKAFEKGQAWYEG